MALLTVQNIGVTAGIAPAYLAAGASDTLPGGQGVFIHVKNAHSVSTTVAIITPENIDGDLAVADRTVTVANATEKMIPVPSRYNDAVTGLATVTTTLQHALITSAALRGPVT